MILVSFCRILNDFSDEVNFFGVAGSPLRSSFFEFGKVLPHPREFDHHFLPRAKNWSKKLPGWLGFARSKKFSPGGCIQLELTETLLAMSKFLTFVLVSDKA